MTSWRRRKRRSRPIAAPDSGPPLDVDVSVAAYGTVVAIGGELDIATAPRVDAALASHEVAEADAVVVDLDGVTFMDSTALGLFLRLERELRGRGARFAIACPEGPARLLFDVTGVGEQLRVYPSRAAAAAALA